MCWRLPIRPPAAGCSSSCAFGGSWGGGEGGVPSGVDGGDMPVVVELHGAPAVVDSDGASAALERDGALLRDDDDCAPSNMYDSAPVFTCTRRKPSRRSPLSPCVQPPAADLVPAVAVHVHCPGVICDYPAAFGADGTLRNASVEHEPASAATPPPAALPCRRLRARGGCGRRWPVGGAVLAERGSCTADATAATAM